MKRKKFLSHVTAIVCGLLLYCSDASAKNDPLVSGSGRAVADRSDILRAEILRQLTNDKADLTPSAGFGFALPTGYEQGYYPGGRKISKYEAVDPYEDYRQQLSYSDGYDDLGGGQNGGRESPFEVEVDDRLSPFDVVNIDRNRNKEQQHISHALPTIVATPSMAKSTEAPRKRMGEMEYDTFVHVPALMQKKEKSRVAVPPAIEVNSGNKRITGSDVGDTVFYAVAGVCSLAAVLGLVFATFSYTRLRRQYKQSQLNEFPSFGFPAQKKSRSPPDSVSAMDSKLASAAQLYHFQHTKQQIISMEHPACDVKEAVSDDSEVEEDEGDYSVYECPGLAPTGNMEINNPIFLKKNGDSSPVLKVDDDHSKLPKTDSGEIEAH